MPLRALLAQPDRAAFLDPGERVRRACEARGVELARLDEVTGRADFFRGMEEAIAGRDLVIADLSPDLYPFSANPIVELVAGCARRLDRTVVIVDRDASIEGSIGYERLEEGLGRALERLATEHAAAALPVRRTNSLGMEFALVRPGAFTMGDPDLEHAPPHRVRLSRPFWLGVHPVTNAQYAAYDGEHSSGIHDEYFLTGVTQPVVDVTWADAVAFCEWLSRTDGLRCRLPTEAEWEFACRAGRSATESRYPWGSDWPPSPPAGNYGLVGKSDPFPVTSPVGKFGANPLGLHDLGGNVWEWCSDGYGELATDGESVDPTGSPSNQHRVLRGGAWSTTEEEEMRTAWREVLEGSDSDVDIGFRVLVEAHESP